MALVDHSTSHCNLRTGKVLHHHIQKWRIKVNIADSKIFYMPDDQRFVILHRSAVGEMQILIAPRKGF